MTPHNLNRLRDEIQKYEIILAGCRFRLQFAEDYNDQKMMHEEKERIVSLTPKLDSLILELLQDSCGES